MRTSWNDEKLELIISVLLRTGVLLAASVVLVGGICFLSNHGQEQPEYQVFQGTPPALSNISGVLHAVGPSNCQAVIQLGLLLLILTPIARVAFSLGGFALERDWTYVGLTFAVFAILIYSLAAPH